jgi:hypothetical protein
MQELILRYPVYTLEKELLLPAGATVSGEILEELFSQKSVPTETIVS